MTDDTEQLVPDHEPYDEAAERIARDEDVDHATAIRLLLAILSAQMEGLLCGIWSIEEALVPRKDDRGKKVLDS